MVIMFCECSWNKNSSSSNLVSFLEVAFFCCFFSSVPVAFPHIALGKSASCSGGSTINGGQEDPDQSQSEIDTVVDFFNPFLLQVKVNKIAMQDVTQTRLKKIVFFLPKAYQSTNCFIITPNLVVQNQTILQTKIWSHVKKSNIVNTKLIQIKK